MLIATKTDPLAISAIRVLFRADSMPGAEIVHQFHDPQPMLAIQQSIDVEEIAATAAGDQIDIVCAIDECEPWLKSTWVTEVKTKAGSVLWAPGRAVIQASSADCDKLLPGLIEFAFYEGELRKLEETLMLHEATAAGDVKFAYEMNNEGRSQWDRLYRTMEQLYALRLRFSRLEPHLDHASRFSPTEARRIFSRLAARTQVAERLESVSNRLEACEDLYEGAIDRITDFKMYRRGHLLEVAIVVLLVIEVVLLLAQWHRL